LQDEAGLTRFLIRFILKILKILSNVLLYVAIVEDFWSPTTIR